MELQLTSNIKEQHKYLRHFSIKKFLNLAYYMIKVYATPFDLNMIIILLESIHVTSPSAGILSYACKMQTSRVPRALAFSHSGHSSACRVPKLLKTTSPSRNSEIFAASPLRDALE
jgi:hypothetical protein